MTQKLEKELQERIAKHKYSIIASSLIMFEDEGIYNSPILRERYGNEEIPNENKEEKAIRITNDLEDNADQETYDKVYEMCWKRAKYTVSNKLYELEN